MEGCFLKLSLYKQDFNFQLKARNKAEVVEHIKQYDKQVLESHQIKVGLKEDGSLRMKCLPRGRYTPPYLKGRIAEEDGKVTLQGIIKESYVEGFTFWIFLFVTLFMTAFTVIILLNDPIWQAVLICGVGAVVFAMIAFLLGRLRNTNFLLDGALIVDGLGLLFQPFTSEEDDYSDQQRNEVEAWK